MYYTGPIRTGTFYGAAAPIMLFLMRFIVLSFYSDFYSLVILLVNFLLMFRFFYISFLNFIGKIFLESL